jgi:hypothetical protein
MTDKTWIKDIGKRIREDLGDCPTVPQALLDVVRQLALAKDDDFKRPMTHFKRLPAHTSGK